MIVTFYVGASVNRTISNDYTYIGAPFLMGTVALGELSLICKFQRFKLHLALYVQIKQMANPGYFSYFSMEIGFDIFCKLFPINIFLTLLLKHIL